MGSYNNVYRKNHLKYLMYFSTNILHQFLQPTPFVKICNYLLYLVKYQSKHNKRHQYLFIAGKSKQCSAKCPNLLKGVQYLTQVVSINRDTRLYPATFSPVQIAKVSNTVDRLQVTELFHHQIHFTQEQNIHNGNFSILIS